MDKPNLPGQQEAMDTTNKNIPQETSGTSTEENLEVKDKLNKRLIDLVSLYKQHIQKLPLQTRKELLVVHKQLKDTYIKSFQTEFADIAISSDLFLCYELKLIGQLNATFNEIKGTCKIKSNTNGHTKIPTVVISSKSTKLSQQARSTDRNAIPGSSKSVQWEMANPSKPKPISINASQLDSSERIKPNPDGATRVDNTPIYYYDNITSSNQFAIVYQGFVQTNNYPQRKAAIKRYLKSSVHLYENELQNWLSIDNSDSYNSIHVTRLLNFANWKSDFFLAIEWAEMNLKERIADMKTHNENDVGVHKKLLKFVEDTAKGVCWLHTKNIVHRDIKPENVLIFKSDTGEEIAKITDFGISRKITENSGLGASTKADGSDNWVAPEVLRAKQNGQNLQSDKLHDLFSLGLTIHFTLSLGEHAFGNSKQHGQMIPWNILDLEVKPKKLPYPNYTANDLIQSMLSKMPKDRPKIENVLKHPLFWDLEKKLNFLVQFMVILYEKNDKTTIKIRKLVEKEYRNWYKDVCQKDDPFNWKHIVDDVKWNAFQEHKIQKKGRKPKAYDEISVVSLLEVIRDKYMHFGDIPDVLLKNEHFGNNGIFSPNRYAEFFLEKFPDLLIFLVGITPSIQKNYGRLHELNESFLLPNHEE